MGNQGDGARYGHAREFSRSPRAHGSAAMLSLTRNGLCETRVVLDLAPLTIGPLVLAGDRALVVLLLGAGLLVAEVLARRSGEDAEWAWIAVLTGLVGARLGFVVANLDVFLQRPLEIVFFWQGGFVAWVGLLVGIAAALWALRRVRLPLTRIAAPLITATGVAAGALLFLPASPTQPDFTQLDFDVVSIEGDLVPVASWVGTPTVVNLWATWCGPCRRELPLILEELGGRGDVRLVLASQGEARATVEAYLNRRELPMDDVYLDSVGALQRASQAVGLPTTLFIDAQGQVVQVAFGELSRAALRDGVAAAQAASN